MRAMVFDGHAPLLEERDVPDPVARAGELLIDVHACGVCRTDLHVVDGELAQPKLPLVAGHEIVGVVPQAGAGETGFAAGDCVGVPWLGHTCGRCRFCLSGREISAMHRASPAIRSMARLCRTRRRKSALLPAAAAFVLVTPRRCYARD